jgi:NAD+ diphosphatase
MAAAVADGHLGLPGRASIARSLIEDWYGARIED